MIMLLKGHVVVLGTQRSSTFVLTFSTSTCTSAVRSYGSTVRTSLAQSRLTQERGHLRRAIQGSHQTLAVADLTPHSSTGYWDNTGSHAGSGGSGGRGNGRSISISMGGDGWSAGSEQNHLGQLFTWLSQQLISSGKVAVAAALAFGLQLITQVEQAHSHDWITYRGLQAEIELLQSSVITELEQTRVETVEELKAVNAEMRALVTRVDIIEELKAVNAEMRALVIISALNVAGLLVIMGLLAGSGGRGSGSTRQ